MELSCVSIFENTRKKTKLNLVLVVVLVLDRKVSNLFNHKQFPVLLVALDVTAAMLVVKNKSISYLWEKLFSC